MAHKIVNTVTVPNNTDTYWISPSELCGYEIRLSQSNFSGYNRGYNFSTRFCNYGLDPGHFSFNYQNGLNKGTLNVTFHDAVLIGPIIIARVSMSLTVTGFGNDVSNYAINTSSSDSGSKWRIFTDSSFYYQSVALNARLDVTHNSQTSQYSHIVSFHCSHEYTGEDTDVITEGSTVIKVSASGSYGTHNPGITGDCPVTTIFINYNPDHVIGGGVT